MGLAEKFRGSRPGNHLRLALFRQGSAGDVPRLLFRTQPPRLHLLGAERLARESICYGVEIPYRASEVFGGGGRGRGGRGDSVPCGAVEDQVHLAAPCHHAVREGRREAVGRG